jgi:hypothetical protein
MLIAHSANDGMHLHFLKAVLEDLVRPYELQDHEQDQSGLQGLFLCAEKPREPTLYDGWTEHEMHGRKADTLMGLCSKNWTKRTNTFRVTSFASSYVRQTLSNFSMLWDEIPTLES